MSNELAIAAVTNTVRNLLYREADVTLPGTAVTTRPLDKARNGAEGPQLNLFLYHTMIDAAWRNMDMPDVLPGETGFPPLPLTLHYLVTAYGRDDDSSDDHRLLGAAMRVLHDHPLLGPGELRTTFPDGDLFRQVERVRITPQPLSLEEMSKLWTTFQTQYRVSAAYEISVVLIESARTNGAGPPVIQRGVGDIGVDVRANLLLPIATITGVSPQAVVEGDTMVVTGHDLEGDTVRLRIRHPALNDPLDTPPVAVATAGRLEAPLPAGLPAGLATVAAVVSRIGHDDFVTGEVGIAIRPTVKNAPFAVNRAGDGHITVTADVAPDVLAGQKAFLVAFGKAHPAEPFATPTTGSLTFRFAAEPGTTPIRLRVGGADSRLILDGPSPTYDPDMRLEVT